MALRYVTLLPRRFVKDVTPMLRGVGRRIQVQTDSDFGFAGIGDSVQTETIAHIRHLLSFVDSIAPDLQRRWFEGATDVG